MTDQPQGINIKFSSFAKKEGYKPPTAGNLIGKKDQKRQRFAPGGDWGDEEDDRPSQQVSVSKPAQRETAEPFDDIIDITPKQDNTSSKFKFIKKQNKGEKTSTMEKADTESVLIDFDTIRSDK